jgi:nucleoside 2-deoxyribosyltransferase
VRLYLAGPLFTQAERRWLRELASGLRGGGHTVFLPQEDSDDPRRDPRDPQATYERNRAAIGACDAVVAVLDGSDADSGTAWECGYAAGLGRPVVALRTDFRGGEDGGLNLMLRRSAAAVVEHASTDERLAPLVAQLLRALEELRAF